MSPISEKCQRSEFVDSAFEDDFRSDDEGEHVLAGDREREEKKRCTPCKIAFWVIGSVVAAALLGLGIWGIVVLCTPEPDGPTPVSDPIPVPGPIPVPIQYTLPTTTPPQPALLDEILKDNVGRGRANFAPDDDVQPADLYNFTQCRNSCYMAAAWSSLLRSPAVRKYLDEVFCPALRNNFRTPRDQNAIDRQGGWQYGFPATFCSFWEHYKTEDFERSDAGYQRWKQFFFRDENLKGKGEVAGHGLEHGIQHDFDDAGLRKGLYMLAVPKPLNASFGRLPAGRRKNGAGFDKLADQQRTDGIPGVTPAFPPNGFHAEFGGVEFMNDVRIVSLAVLRGHGDELDAGKPASWRNSKCIRQVGRGDSDGLETTIRCMPEPDDGRVINLQSWLSEKFTHSLPVDDVMNAWREEPLPDSPPECQTANGKGQANVEQLVYLPKSGLLPVFITRMVDSSDKQTGNTVLRKNSFRLQVPLTLNVKREWFAEAVEEGHKPGKGQDWQYSLRSFASHSGDSLDGGHWYAFAKVGKNWFELNNGKAGAVAVPDINAKLREEERRITQIFYERVK